MPILGAITPKEAPRSFSTDIGTEPTYHFLTAGTSTLWAGGETPLFTPFLLRSINGGENWTYRFVTNSENYPLAMAFDPSDGDIAFLGMASGLRWTVDNGGSWTLVPSAGFHAFPAMGTRAVGPLRLYVNGSPLSPTATFLKTDDGGTSWTPVASPASGSSDVLAMLVRSGPATDTLFLGTASGVLRYVELVVVGVAPSVRGSRLVLLAQPNVFRTGTTLRFELPRTSRVSLRVLDSGGREVVTLLSGEKPAGQHSLTWEARGLPSGAYFCELRAGGDRVTQKVMVVR